MGQKTAVPTNPTLDNFDPGRDAAAGLLLARGGVDVDESDANKQQTWIVSAGGVPLDGPASLTLWSAMLNFDTLAAGSMTAYLVDSDASASSLTEIASATITRADWDVANSGTWIQDTFNFGNISYTLGAGRYLGVKLIVDASAGDDMWVAYDATPYPARLDYVEVSNDPPTDIAPGSFGVAENTNTTGGHSLAALTASDPNAGESFTYSILAGGDGALFSIGGVDSDELILDDGVLDFETKASYSVNVRVTDSASNTYDETLTVNVSDVNEAATVTLNNTVSLAEDTDTAADVKVADIVVNDDALGSNTLSLSGTDAASFKIVGTELFLQAGTSLDFETQNSYDVTVNVDDTGVTGSPDDAVSHTLSVNDVNEAATVTLSNLVTALNENTATTLALRVADITITDDALGSNTLTLGGADAAHFEIVGNELRLQAGTTLDFEAQASYDVLVRIDDAAVFGTPDGTVAYSLAVNDVNESPTLTLTNLVHSLVDTTDTSSAIRIADLVVGDDALGSETFSLSGSDAGLFEIVGNELRLRAGTVLDATAQPSLSVTVELDDPAVAGTPDDAAAHVLTLSTGNTAPLAVDDHYSTYGGTLLSVAAPGLLADDTDPNGDILTAQLVSGPAHGSLILQTDGSFYYAPNIAFVGTDSFQYIAHDGAAGSNVATVTLEVKAVPRPPLPTSEPPPPIQPPPPSDSPFDDPPPISERSDVEQDEQEEDTQEIQLATSQLRESRYREAPPSAVPVLPVHQQEERELTQLDLMALSIGAAPTVPVGNLLARETLAGNSGMSPSTTVRLNSEQGAAVDSHVRQVWGEIDNISQELKRDKFYQKIMFSTVVGSSTIASAGFALWTVRTGYFTAMLLTATPTWATLDVVSLLDFEDTTRRTKPPGRKTPGLDWINESDSENESWSRQQS